MNITQKSIEYATLKTSLFSMLNQGVIIKKFWDELRELARELSLDDTIIEDVYTKFNLMSMVSYKSEKNVPEVAPAEARIIPETIYRPTSVKSMGDKFSRQDAFNIWRDALEEMKKIVEPSDFDNYLRPMTLKSMSSSKVILQVKTEYVQEWAENCEQLADVLSKHIGSPVIVEIKVAG